MSLLTPAPSSSRVPYRHFNLEEGVVNYLSKVFEGENIIECIETFSEPNLFIFSTASFLEGTDDALPRH